MDLFMVKILYHVQFSKTQNNAQNVAKWLQSMVTNGFKPFSNNSDICEGIKKTLLLSNIKISQ